jgi:hypothetical protein
MNTTLPTSIMIGYRKNAGGDFARRLADSFNRGNFPDDVLIDAEHLNPGQDWRKQIEEWLKRCRAYVLVVEPGFWEYTRPGSPVPALWETDDVLRWELRRALERDADQSDPFKVFVLQRGDVAPPNTEDVSAATPDVRAEVAAIARQLAEKQQTIIPAIAHHDELERFGDTVLGQLEFSDSEQASFLSLVKSYVRANSGGTRTIRSAIRKAEKGSNAGANPVRNAAIAGVGLLAIGDHSAAVERLEAVEANVRRGSNPNDPTADLAVAAALCGARFRGMHPAKIASVASARSTLTLLQNIIQRNLKIEYGQIQPIDGANPVEALAMHKILVEGYFEFREINLVNPGTSDLSYEDTSPSSTGFFKVSGGKTYLKGQLLWTHFKVQATQDKLEHFLWTGA